MRHKEVNIYTNAVDLAKKIMKLKEDGQDFDIELVEGIGGEKVVKLSNKACYWEDED